MTTARIYQPAKTATQSGMGKTAEWLLEFEPRSAQERDSLMGWTGSRDTRRQVCLRFRTRDQALAYAKKQGLDCRVEPPRRRTLRPMNYADNFR